MMYLLFAVCIWTTFMTLRSPTVPYLPNIFGLIATGLWVLLSAHAGWFV